MFYPMRFLTLFRTVGSASWAGAASRTEELGGYVCHMTSEWSLRPAVADDREFLFDLHRASMRSLVEELFGPWEDAAQWEFFDRWFRPEDVFVIRLGEEDVGVLGLESHIDGIYVTRIEVRPDSQGQGIGSAVMRRILQEAGEAEQPVSLHVFAINPARSLYHRLGFVTLEEHQGRVLMKAIPGQDRDNEP